MRNLVKYVGIGLLVMGLAACDDKDTNATAQGSVAESNATGNPVNLLDGKLSFSLPADMTRLHDEAVYLPISYISMMVVSKPELGNIPYAPIATEIPFEQIKPVKP